MKRRAFLAAGAAGLAAPALLRPRLARAAAHTGGAAALPAAMRFAVGDMTLTALLDGTLHIGPESLIGIEPDAYDDLMTAAFRDPATYPSAINAFLVQTGDQTILIDTGSGGAMGEGAGKLPANLSGAGVAPEDVTRLIVTHLHPDHIGGAVADGSAVFPNAEVHLAEAERAFWTDDANFSGADEMTRSFVDLARGTLNAYSDRLSPFDGETEVAPGITSMPLPGHTPGHTGFMLSSGDDAVLIWTDIVHVPPVQLARPDVAIGFDVDPEQAVETRMSILDRVVADRLMIAGSHMGFPGLANIEADGDGYRAIDAMYGYDA